MLGYTSSSIMNFRKFKRFLIVFLCVFLMLIPAFSSKAATEDNPGEALTVGVPADRCPIFYEDADTGEIVGIGVDLMRSAAKKAGYNATFKAIEEATLKDALDNPAYDVILPFGSAITSTGGQASIVSENLIQTPFTLVTKGQHDMPPINVLKIGMLHSLSGAADTVHQLYPEIQITMYETMQECVQALRSDEVNALLHNSYVWSYVLQKPSYSDLTVQPSSMFSMDFRVGAADTEKGRDIIQRLNGGIASLTDTERQAVILDYTSRRLYRMDFGDFLYKYGVFILLILLLFVALIIIGVQRVHSIRKKNEENLQQMIDHDPLTGVLSMRSFRKRVVELLSTHPDTPYLLAYVNIKNFKYINDSLGWDSGDDLLCFWADKTRKTLSDQETMCRINADRFAVLRCVGGEEKLNFDDHEVVDSVRNYFLDQGKETRVQICGGLYVLTPEDYQEMDVDHMLDLARVAEKKVREMRSDGYEFYNPQQWEKGKHIAEVTNRLPAALEAGDIQVWYQPQVDYETGKITGAEALCRWDHKKLGWLQPTDFISTLEESGLIFDLDKYVWDKVCQDLHRWNEQGHRRFISVNVSRCDIREDRDIPKQFHDLIKQYDLDPEQLRIEITETAYAENSALLIRTTEQLREYGFQVEMDDFGSGYSSLHMLKEVPVDRIKLDLRFLTDAGDPERGRIIIGYMIRMIRSLGMQMITEGVETKEQADFLFSQGSTEMQGYYFHRPMPVQDYEQL